MKNNYMRAGLLTAIFAFSFMSCEDLADPIIEDLDVDRAFAPTGLTARVRNLTTIELQWNVRDDADHYVVEFSDDSLEFANIIRTVTVNRGDLPLQETFDGETRYSARVKAVSALGKADSKWAAETVVTARENIFLPSQDGDIGALEAVVRWQPNAEVTHFIINPGNTERIISADEKEVGAATITGLTAETAYTVILRKDDKHRGQIQFETLLDIGNATAVHPEDDLAAVIAAASSGDVLVLFPGEYETNAGASILIDKSITMRGLYPYDKPKLHVQFTIENAGTSVEVRDLDLDGDGVLEDVFRFTTASVEFGAMNLIGCNVHDFKRSLVGANASSSKVLSLTIDNCIMTDMLTAGGDFIDFRNTHLGNLTIQNSTFDNCTPTRDFIRIDGVAPTNGYSGTGLTTNVLIDQCTLYGVSNNTGSNRRILYVRFDANAITVRNTIIAESSGIYTNQAGTSQPAFQKNNYFNAPRFFNSEFEVIANLKVDNSGTHTALDPGFADAAGGNFTISNQTLKDNNVGDPRWR